MIYKRQETKFFSLINSAAKKIPFNFGWYWPNLWSTPVLLQNNQYARYGLPIQGGFKKRQYYFSVCLLVHFRRIYVYGIRFLIIATLFSWVWIWSELIRNKQRLAILIYWKKLTARKNNYKIPYRGAKCLID